jgi:O-succinylbenzoate synthase
VKPLPSADDLVACAHVVALPMVTRFRGTTVREAVLLEGPHGWCEFGPFPEYPDAEAATWLAAAIDFGWHAQPTPVRDRIPVNATIPAVPASAVPDILGRYDGCRTAKVKVAEPGQNLADDVARVRAAREALGASGRIRVDANGAWTVDEAERAIHRLTEFGLEYVEQPCRTVPELAELRRRIARLGVRVAADESVRKAEDPLAVARAGAADILVVKAAPLGGVRRALRLVAQAHLPAVVSSALDTSVGVGMGVALAAALPELPYDCGLATASLFLRDVSDPPVVPRGGVLPVRAPHPDPTLIADCASPPRRRSWWLARLRRCRALLGAGA